MAFAFLSGMTGDVKSVDTMLKVQGERVVVHWRWHDGTGEGVVLCTFVHVVDVDRRELRLVNRDERSRQPDWGVSQKLFESIRPMPPNTFNAKWQLHAVL